MYYEGIHLSCLKYTYSTEEHGILCRVIRHAEDREFRPTGTREKRIVCLKLEGKAGDLRSSLTNVTHLRSCMTAVSLLLLKSSWRRKRSLT